MECVAEELRIVPSRSNSEAQDYRENIDIQDSMQSPHKSCHLHPKLGMSQTSPGLWIEHGILRGLVHLGKIWDLFGLLKVPEAEL